MSVVAGHALMDPLGHPRSSLANHAEPGLHAESSRTAQARNLGFSPGPVDERRGSRSQPETQPSPKINPFHLLVHPDSDEALPPLPAHIEAMIRDDGGNSGAESQEDLSAHSKTLNPAFGAAAFREPVELANGHSGPARASFDRMSAPFKSTRNGASPVSLQEPPPSPPISEIAIEPEDEYTAAFDHPDTHTGGYTDLGLPIILSTELTSEPAEVEDASGHILPNSPQPQITRRLTNPAPSSPVSVRSPLTHSQSTFGPQQQKQTAVPGVDGAALDSDILAQAETIRRERLERRQKKATTDAATETAARQDSAKVLVGNLIGEDHVNYVLMYNMLTGIRIGVSRCQAKLRRPLVDEDYMARHKYSFDIVGNELTPSARYDFKFKDYAPWVFRDLREEHFHLDPADYLLSLTAKYILSELGSPGKSGSFFYFSRDYRFIIKTISHSEHKFLRSILKDYHEHVRSNPHTLLSRFYGLHRVKLPRGRKIHFVIMNNLFPPHRDVHETFDLKGSAYGREYPEEKARENPKAVLKDMNWVKRGRVLELGPEKRALFSEQLRRDMHFLRKVKVMDYSLLVGIHNMARGNRDNIRENQLSMFNPDVHMRRKPSAAKPASEASNVRKAVRRSDPKMLDVESQLPNTDSADRRNFLFYQDEGGLRATDEANQNLDIIYYLGVIDICTPYNNAKKLEHMWKSMTEDRQTISCTDPVTYGQRFLNFLLSVMRGGDPALRPAGLSPADAHLKTE